MTGMSMAWAADGHLEQRRVQVVGDVDDGAAGVHVGRASHLEHLVDGEDAVECVTAGVDRGSGDGVDRQMGGATGLDA